MKFFTQRLPWYRWVLICIVIGLAVIPFFWLKPGEMDLGGDSSRLYFYDPVSYLKNFSLYGVIPEGQGAVEPNFFYLPFLLLLSALKALVRSPYLLITIFNVLKLLGGFLAVWAIIKELLWPASQSKVLSAKREIAAICGGLLYVFTPTMTGNWTAALTSHLQVFLNPFLFYLLLRFCLTGQAKYLWLLLATSFGFAPNFALTSAPPFFAFYPGAILFIFIYVAQVRKKRLPVAGLLWGFFFFLGLQAFHLIPQIASLLDPGSFSNTRVFAKEGGEAAVNYFLAIRGLAKVSPNILLPSLVKQTLWTTATIPLVVILGLCLNRPKSKALLLTGVFFLISLFLLSANITDTGVEVYKRLFYIPGFSMFRNFLGQWSFVFSFFYALLFGQALFRVLARAGERTTTLISLIFIVLLPFNAWPFVKGDFINQEHRTARGVKIPVVMDTDYEAATVAVRALPPDGKILTLPFTDFYYQVVYGKNNGAYVGPSVFAALTGKKDFVGYQIMQPFAEVFLQLAREENYSALRRLLAILNIRYIFHNSDPRVYDSMFPEFPYSYVRGSLPKNQKEYAAWITRLGAKPVLTKGFYSLYELNLTETLPHFYLPQAVKFYPKVDTRGNPNISFFSEETSPSPRVAYFEKEECARLFASDICQKSWKPTNLPRLYFQQINPTKYQLRIEGAKDPFWLVFSEKYHKNWKLFLHPTSNPGALVRASYFNEEIQEGDHRNIFLDRSTLTTWKLSPLAEERHVLTNGYANGWYLKPQDAGGRVNYELVVEMTGQRTFYISLTISIAALILFGAWGIRLLE